VYDLEFLDVTMRSSMPTHTAVTPVLGCSSCSYVHVESRVPLSWSRNECLLQSSSDFRW